MSEKDKFIEIMTSYGPHDPNKGNYPERSEIALFAYENTNFKGTFQSNPERSGTYQNVLFHCFSLERSKPFVFKIACDVSLLT